MFLCSSQKDYLSSWNIPASFCLSASAGSWGGYCPVSGLSTNQVWGYAQTWSRLARGTESHSQVPDESQGTSLKFCRAESGKNKITPPILHFPQEAVGEGPAKSGVDGYPWPLSLTLGQMGRESDEGKRALSFWVSMKCGLSPRVLYSSPWGLEESRLAGLVNPRYWSSRARWDGAS